MAATKAATIDAYIATFPDEVQSVLQRVRRTIRQALPEAHETISYAIPAFDQDGKHVVFFAGWKRYVSVYPLPAGDASFQQAIAPYKRARGSIQFPYKQGVPYELIGEIARRLHEEKHAT